MLDSTWVRWEQCNGNEKYQHCNGVKNIPSPSAEASAGAQSSFRNEVGSEVETMRDIHLKGHTTFGYKREWENT